MRFLVTILLGASIAVACIGTEKGIELRLLKPELRVLFKGNTQAGEKTQSFEIRELYHTVTGKDKSVPDTVNFYVVHDPDCETAFWPPEILKQATGFEPVLKSVTPDIYYLYYFVGNSGLRRETWKLSKEKGPVLEKEENLDRREHPAYRKS